MGPIRSIKLFFNFTILFIVLISAAQGKTESFPEFTIMTEEWKPYNFIEDGKVQGISVDIFVMMLERIGSKQGRKDIMLLPWVRGYEALLTIPNAILFTMTKTEEREALFKWVCPIFENTIALHALKRRNITINSLEDLKKYKIGTYIKDVGEEILIKKTELQISDFDRSPEQSLGLRKLFAGRNDLFIGSQVTVDKLCDQEGYQKREIEPVFTLSRDVMCFAVHKEIPDRIIETFQKAFDELIAEGKLDDLFQKYIPRSK